MFKLERQGTPKAAKLRQLIKERELIIFENRLIKTAVYLDKRFSFTLALEDQEVAKVFINQVWRKLKNLAGEDTDDQIEEDFDPPEGENAVEDQEAEFEEYLGGLAGSQSLPNRRSRDQQQQQMNQLFLELQAYDKLPRLAAADQIMDFWKNTREFPLLKEIALAIISAHVTEVSVERIFSHLTDFHSEPLPFNVEGRPARCWKLCWKVENKF